MRFIQQAFRKHHRKTQVQSCATPLQPITVPPQPVTTEFTRRLAQAQAMVLVTQCQRVEKALIDGPGAAVSVRVVRATGLLAADKGGTSDPFVTVLSKGSKKAKTSVKKKTLEPEWDETLDLTVPDLAAPLSLTVMDYDKVCTPNPHPEPSPGPNFAPVRNSARDPNPYPDPNPTLDHDTIGITD